MSKGKKQQEGKQYSPDQYKAVGCKQINDDVGIALLAATKGTMCNGCGYKDSECKSYVNLGKGTDVAAESAKGNSKPARKEFHAKPPKIIHYEETVRAEAARRSISIKQVRRERTAAAQ